MVIRFRLHLLANDLRNAISSIDYSSPQRSVLKLAWLCYYRASPMEMEGRDTLATEARLAHRVRASTPVPCLYEKPLTSASGAS